MDIESIYITVPIISTVSSFIILSIVPFDDRTIGDKGGRYSRTNNTK